MNETEQPQITVTLAVTDWQLVMTVLQQALLPYQRLGQLMQEMQKQSMAQQGHPPTAAELQNQMPAAS